MKHVVILGAGISGLSLAWFLKKRFAELKITIIEKTSTAGGWIQTINHDGFLFEKGPRSIRSKGVAQKTLELIEELSLQDQVIAASPVAKTRYLWSHGKLRSLPQGLFSFFTSSTTRHLVKAFLQEPFVAKGNENDESIASFISRRLGKQVADELIDPVVSGIFAGDIDRLSMRACFPNMHSWEKQHGSIVKGAIFGGKKESAINPSPFVKQMDKVPIFSFLGGVQTLTDGLASQLTSHILFSTKVKSLSKLSSGVEIATEDGKKIQADHLFSTVPAHFLGRYLEDIDGELSALLRQIEATTVAAVHLGYRHSVLKEKGFGYLIPSREKEKILGVVFDSSVFPQQSSSPDETRLTVMIGGAHENIESIVEEELEERAIQGVRKHLNIQVDPDVVLTTVAKQAIPQYHVGHLERLRKIKELLGKKHPWLTIIGNFFEGVSVNECIMKGHQVAKSYKVDA